MTDANENLIEREVGEVIAALPLNTQLFMMNPKNYKSKSDAINHALNVTKALCLITGFEIRQQRIKPLSSEVKEFTPRVNRGKPPTQNNSYMGREGRYPPNYCQTAPLQGYTNSDKFTFIQQTK